MARKVKKSKKKIKAKKAARRPKKKAKRTPAKKAKVKKRLRKAKRANARKHQNVKHPGMMGDGTEEQNLNQPGNFKARIKEDEVDAVFRNLKK